MQVLTSPDEKAEKIRNYLRNNNEMLKGNPDQYLNHPLGGVCYVASEAYLALQDDREAWTPHYLAVEWDGGSASHWYLVHDETGKIVDLTAEQFNAAPRQPNYSGGTGRGFLPPSPSSRAEKVIESVQ